MNSDLEHLRLLSIFYYVRAGIDTFFSMFSLIYIFMGTAFAALPIGMPPQPVATAPSQVEDTDWQTGDEDYDPDPESSDGDDGEQSQQKLSATPPVNPAPPPPAMFAAFGMMFVVMGVIMLVIGLTFALLAFLAGRYISSHRHRVFCLVVAGIGCLSFPLGTILGVFTFIVLLRPSVISLFEPRGEVEMAEAVLPG